MNNNVLLRLCFTDIKKCKCIINKVFAGLKYFVPYLSLLCRPDG